MIIRVIGTQKTLMNATEYFLHQFGFETSDHSDAVFALELLEDSKCRIEHNSQEELAGFLRSFLSEFGICEVVQNRKDLTSQNMRIYALPNISGIEATAIGKLIAYSIKEYYE